MSSLNQAVRNVIRTSHNMDEIRFVITILREEEEEESKCWEIIMQSLNERVCGMYPYKPFFDILKTATEAGMNINHVNIHDHTPLMEALVLCYSKMAEVLFDLGANVNFCGPNTARTALSIAIRNSRNVSERAFTEALIVKEAKLGGRCETWDKDIFFFPTFIKRIDILNKLIKQFVDAGRDVPWCDIFKVSVQNDFEEGALDAIGHYDTWHKGRDRLTIDRECFRLATTRGHQEVMGILITQNPLVLLDEWLTRDKISSMDKPSQDFKNWLCNWTKFKDSLQTTSYFHILSNLGKDAVTKIDNLPIPVEHKETLKSVLSDLSYTNDTTFRI